MAYTYPDYSYDWYDNPPPYRPDSSPSSSYNYDSPASYLSTSSSNYNSNYDDSRFNLNRGASLGDRGSVQNGQTPQSEAAPNSAVPPAQPRLVSEPQT
ncbi:MAG: hypothetical protein ABSG23_08435 [Terriglobales bacterium]